MGVGEFDDDPTVVEPVGDWNDQPTTQPYATEQFLAGYFKGKQEGRVEAFAALRLALLSVGVEAHEVEPIVDRVKRFIEDNARV